MKKLLVALMLTHIFNYGFSQTIISDLRPGMDGSDPVLANSVVLNNDLYFIANEGSFGNCIYKTNGSTITKIIGDPSDYATYFLLGSLGNSILYYKYDLLNDAKSSLMKTNGQIGDSELVYEFNDSGLNLIYNLKIVVGNILYFYAVDNTHGYELWRTDGTTNGTYLVKDINPGSASSIMFVTGEDVSYFVELNGIIYFGAVDGVHGAELWRSDGSENGTYLVKDIEPLTNEIEYYGSSPVSLTKYNNAIYFSAFRNVDGRELWKSDGTEAGTVLVQDISSGSSQPRDMVVYNNQLFFVADHATIGGTVFKTNGTPNSVVPVKQPSAGGPSNPNKLYLFKDKIFFQSESNLWSSDGSASGTVQMPKPATLSWVGTRLYPTTNYLYFFGSDYNSNEFIYRTKEQNNTIERITNVHLDYDYERFLKLINNCLVFSADNGSTGDELYTVCNQNSQPLEIEEVQNTTIDIFPNPCVDQIQLKVNFNLSEINSIQLISLEGSETQVDFKMKSESVIQINGLNQFSRGIYFLNVITESGNKLTQKVVIQ